MRKKDKLLPIIIEKGEDGYYVAECPILPGCYTQGKTLDEALKNIREVIKLIFEEDKNKKRYEVLQKML
ncbi:MAG: type II toxin-antitoxin system HicB family antitoxin [bacterium]